MNNLRDIFGDDPDVVSALRQSGGIAAPAPTAKPAPVPPVADAAGAAMTGEGPARGVGKTPEMTLSCVPREIIVPSMFRQITRVFTEISYTDYP